MCTIVLCSMLLIGVLVAGGLNKVLFIQEIAGKRIFANNKNTLPGFEKRAGKLHQISCMKFLYITRCFDF